VFHLSRIGGLFGRLSPRGDRTGEQQTSISKTVLPSHARWDIGLFQCSEVITTSYVRQ